MLREKLGEHCPEREIGGTLGRERDWGNTVLRERLAEHFTEREIGRTMF